MQAEYADVPSAIPDNLNFGNFSEKVLQIKKMFVSLGLGT